MMTPNPRALRLALLAALVAGAFSLSARTAQAQWGDPVCGDPNTIQAVFSDFSFNGMDKCEAACKATASLCKSLVRDAAGCNQTSWKGYWGLLSREECDTLTDPAERKSCNASVKGFQSDSHDMVNSDRDTALASCDASKDACIMDCSAIVLNH
jgi:hypothetical protein